MTPNVRMRPRQRTIPDAANRMADLGVGGEQILRTVAEHKVRRLPVIDGHALVGIVAQADVARSPSDQDNDSLLGALSVDY